MRLAQSLFFLVAAALALAVGTAKAEDKIGKDANDPGFNALDKNKDGYLSRTEAAGNSTLVKKFKQADSNGDGKLSRTEYLKTMTKQDAATAKKKIQGAMDRNRDDKRSAAAGSTHKDNKDHKGDKIGKDANDPGFNALDKDNDGFVSRAEAMGNPNLSKGFKQADKNNDGKLSRAEYLAAMTKQDAKTAKRKVENAVDKNK